MKSTLDDATKFSHLRLTSDRRVTSKTVCNRNFFNLIKIGNLQNKGRLTSDLSSRLIELRPSKSQSVGTKWKYGRVTGEFLSLCSSHLITKVP